MSDTHIFGTVLVNRKINSCPREWELQLRPISRKIRVVENLLGGAHLLVTGTPSVAVRIYNTEDTCRFEEKSAKASADSRDIDMEIGGLPYFRDTYEHSIVIFVLLTGQQQRDQLSRRDSFVNAAQRALLLDRKDDGNKHEKKHISRVAVVTEISHVVRIIESVVQSLLPEKREKRRLYFAQIADQNFLPREDSQQIQEVIANHTTKAFVAWSDRFAMPPGDSSVALSVLGSLANVTTANRSILKDVPIRNVSKEMIMRFFGVEKADMQSYENMARERIDESEFLERPDQSIHNATYPPPHHIVQTHLSPAIAQNNHPLDSRYLSHRTYGDAEHRDNIFYPPESHTNSIQSFQMDNNHDMHTNQLTQQGYGRYSHPDWSAMYFSNQFT